MYYEGNVRDAVATAAAESYPVVVFLVDAGRSGGVATEECL